MIARGLADDRPKDRAFYVYAVARARNRRKPGPLPRVGIVPQARVHTLGHRGLVAVFSPVSLTEFGPAALESRLKDADWSRERVLAHHRVLAALLRHYSLVPFKFCTLFRSKARVGAMLSEHRAAFGRTLSRVEGAAEWGVKVFCDRRVLEGHIEDSSDALGSLRRELTAASSGAGYFVGKRLQRAVQTEAQQLVDSCVEESHARFAACGREAIANARQPPAVHGRSAEMVLNSAYLVDDDKRAGLSGALEALEDTYAGKGFQYQLTGPWPPYNFATLELEDTVHAAGG